MHDAAVFYVFLHENLKSMKNFQTLHCKTFNHTTQTATCQTAIKSKP